MYGNSLTSSRKDGRSFSSLLDCFNSKIATQQTTHLAFSYFFLVSYSSLINGLISTFTNSSGRSSLSLSDSVYYSHDLVKLNVIKLFQLNIQLNPLISLAAQM